MSTTGLSRTQAETYIDRFGSTRVLVLGDVMLDRYFWGQVDRISPEAPVPIVRVNRRSARLGGAANVAANLRAVGVQVTVAGAIGDDRAGDEVRSLLEEQGIGGDGLVVTAGGETTEKVRIIAQSQQVVRADFESEPDESKKRNAEALSRVSEKWEGYDALVISDYGKGVLGEAYLGELIHRWRREGKPVLVDPHVGHFRWYRGASIVTPNAKEAASYFGATVHRDQLLESFGFRMREELDLEALLITRGEEGMSLFLKGDERIQIPTDAKEVYDVTGAGDTVIGILAAAIACGAPIVDAVILANRAAGEVVKEVGTTAITRDRLLTAFS
jgi:D-beta-D-heptose 7-phosphate kinase/D-beta-D-heptose 1-phosphate adenosyltransferase